MRRSTRQPPHASSFLFWPSCATRTLPHSRVTPRRTRDTHSAARERSPSGGRRRRHVRRCRRRHRLVTRSRPSSRGGDDHHLMACYMDREGGGLGGEIGDEQGGEGAWRLVWEGKETENSAAGTGMRRAPSRRHTGTGVSYGGQSAGGVPARGMPSRPDPTRIRRHRIRHTSHMGVVPRHACHGAGDGSCGSWKERKSKNRSGKGGGFGSLHAGRAAPPTLGTPHPRHAPRWALATGTTE